MSGAGTGISDSSGYPGYYDARGVGIYGNTLYASDSYLDPAATGMFRIGTAGTLPTALQTTAGGALPGLVSANYDPWIFVFQSATSIWVADTGFWGNPNPAQAFNVINFQLLAGVWTQVSTIFFEASPIRSIAGRLEGGVWTVYAVSPTTLYKYSTLYTTVTVLATAGPGSLFRGVAPAPVAPLTQYISASRLPSFSQTRTQTPTATPSQSSS